MSRRLLSLLALGFVLVSCTGCVEHSVQGDVETFSYPILAGLGLFLGGVGAAVGGWMLRENRFGIILLIGGPIASLAFAPNLFVNKVRMDGEKISIRTGMWFAPTTLNAKYSELQSVSLSQEEHSGRRGRKYTKLYLNFNSAQGSTKVPVDGVVEEAIGQIAARLRAAEVRIMDLSPG